MTKLAFVCPFPTSASFRASSFCNGRAPSPQRQQLQEPNPKNVSVAASNRAPSMLLERFFKPHVVFDVDKAAELYPAIQVTDLRKTFKKRVKGKGSRKKENRTVTALDGVTFSVERGQILGVLGPNSSGKTTTLRSMATLCEQDSGSIELYGVDTVKRSYLARELMGFVAQSASLDKTLTGREHLDMFADLAHVLEPDKKEVIELMIHLLNLEDFIDRQAGVYSGGVIRRLDMAIALLHQPPILILDEPTVGLDIESRRVIWDVLQSYRDRGGTAVLSSHYLEEVDLLSDKVIILEKGVVLADGTPTDLKNGLGGDRISIRLKEFTTHEDAETACHILQRRGLVQSSQINHVRNNSIELVVDSTNARIGGEIVQALGEVGFERLFSFAQSKPSLDDVYLAATGKTLSDADASARQQRTAQSMLKETMA